MNRLVIKIFTLTTFTSVLFSNCSNSSQKTGETVSAIKDTIIPAFDTTSLDRAYKPQDDFDSFANGGWKKRNPIPATENNWGAFHVLDKENKEVKLKGIIKDVLNKENQPGSDDQKIADMYRSFMDTNTIYMLALKPLKPYIDQINSIKTVNEWIAVSGELQKIGIGSAFAVYVDADDHNSKMNVVKTYQTGLSLGEKGYYTATDDRMKMIRSEFTSHVDRMLSYGAWASPEGAKLNGKTLLAFETSLAKIQLSNVEMRDPVKTYNKISMTEFKQLVKNDWPAFFTRQGVNTDTIIVQNKAYFTNLDKLVSGTPVEQLKQYTYYKLVTDFSTYLFKPIKNEAFNFYEKTLSGTNEQKKRDIEAIDITEALGEKKILGRLYVKHFFPESSKKKVAEMIENVRKVYGERIDKLTWMSDSTKIMARKKLSTFTYKIGYPDKWDDFSSITIKPNTLVENVVSNRLWSHNKMLSEVNKPVDKNKWQMAPQEVNAYYNPLNNEVVFPAGILQAPFFNPDADDAINYGGIIAVIGHEFTHGFDDQGAQYDETGNIRNWWTKQDAENFKKLGSRYVAYFSTFEPLPKIRINGELTIGENIADLGGLTLAYYALVKSMEGKPQPPKINGFTWDQRFFLGWAQVWHNNIKDEALRNRLQTDPHAPARYRINGPLKHMNEFYKAFNVQEGDKMWIPEKDRVAIW